MKRDPGMTKRQWEMALEAEGTRRMQAARARQIERDIANGRTRQDSESLYRGTGRRVSIDAAEPGRILDFICRGGPRTQRAIMARLATVARMLGSMETPEACELGGCDRRTIQRLTAKCRTLPIG